MQGKRTPTGKGREAVDKALADVLELFESGELPAAVARTTIRRLESDAPSAAWSLGNQLLMLLAGSEDSRGYKQWQAAGRHVKKGAKAHYILAPSTRKVTDTDPATGEEVSRTAVVGFVGVPVFAVESTEGAELVKPDYRPAQLPPLFEVAERLGVAVRWLPFADRVYGYYCPGREEVVLCSPDAAVFWHELSHAAHERVLSRSGRSLQGGQNAGQEVVAETCAAVLARLYDFELGNVATSAEYIRHYAGDPAKAVMRVLADVQAVLDVILGEGASAPSAAPAVQPATDEPAPAVKAPAPRSQRKLAKEAVAALGGRRPTLVQWAYQAESYRAWTSTLAERQKRAYLENTGHEPPDPYEQPGRFEQFTYNPRSKDAASVLAAARYDTGRVAA